MKKNSCLVLLLLGIIFFAYQAAFADETSVKDIKIDTDGGAIKISINSNYPLQTEAFKSEEGPESYIILDFLGQVYSALPPVIEVNKEPVERISLIKGGASTGKPSSIDSYPLDFLAITLSAKAEYEVTETDTLVTLEIKPVQQEGKIQPSGDKVIELKPTIIVSKAKEPQQSKQEAVKENKKVLKQETKPEVKEVKKAKKEKKKFFFFRASKKKKAKESNLQQEQVVKEKEPQPSETVVKKDASKTEKPLEEKNVVLDDTLKKVVEEIAKEKDKSSQSIDGLTLELKKIKDELSLSTSEKTKLEARINEILSRLDELKRALDKEIERRQRLGEKVEELVAKRDIYIKAKQVFELYSRKFSEINNKVDNLMTESSAIQGSLDSANLEKKHLDEKKSLLESEYAKFKSDYEDILKEKAAVTDRITDLSQQIERLKTELKIAEQDKQGLQFKLNGMEIKNKGNTEELANIKQLLAGKDAQISDLNVKFDQVKRDLDAAVAEKIKIDAAYRNAQKEYDAIKKELEEYLRQK